jgi:hypothetical protein
MAGKSRVGLAAGASDAASVFSIGELMPTLIDGEKGAVGTGFGGIKEILDLDPTTSFAIYGLTL